MDNITNTMTARLTAVRPASFGMPACGHAIGWTQAGLGVDTTSVVRERKAAMGYFPGNPAWRPPTS